LNLTFETREGILKHCSLKHARELGDVGRRFLDRTQASLEAQLANIADEIAYNNHDVDDGLRSGLITLEQLAALPLFTDQLRRIEREHPGLKPQLAGSELVREMIGRLVADLVKASSAAIAAAAPLHVDDVRALSRGLIGFSPPLREEQLLLKRFLRDALYTHPRVQQMTEQARDTVRFLFESLRADHDRMPEEHAAKAKKHAAAGDDAAAARVVADYIAGMTDRFALQTRDALRAGR
jgi:dGTPase